MTILHKLGICCCFEIDISNNEEIQENVAKQIEVHSMDTKTMNPVPGTKEDYNETNEDSVMSND